MTKIITESLLAGLQKYGLTVTLLGFAVFWMNGKNENLSVKVDAQNVQIIDIYKNQHKIDQQQTDKLLHVIELNTQAVENFSFYLKQSK